MAQKDTGPDQELTEQSGSAGEGFSGQLPRRPGGPCSAVGGHWAAVDLCVQVVASEILCITGTT